MPACEAGHNFLEGPGIKGHSTEGAGNKGHSTEGPGNEGHSAEGPGNEGHCADLFWCLEEVLSHDVLCLHRHLVGAETQETMKTGAHRIESRGEERAVHHCVVKAESQFLPERKGEGKERRERGRKGGREKDEGREREMAGGRKR